tara:strand:- start:385 stop:579 length:195 start_codon:yes stop_codon:yes gene_type:complete
MDCSDLKVETREFLEEFALPMVEKALERSYIRPPHPDISEVTRLLELVVLGMDQEITRLRRAGR